MSSDLIQTIVVTIVALAAAALVVRRLFVSTAPAPGQEGCAGCPSAQSHAPSKSKPAPDVHPAVLIRR
jgi:hypothetical protein